MEATQLERLRQSINSQLELCDSVDTPTICSMLADNDPSAKEKLVDLIIKKIVNQKMDIPQAIVAIETEFNPNMMD